ncbi:DUF6179 domain-containing protein [Clostridium scatologenes]|uniref:Uncharacterized protein n=1 Tax=Clostridium scatologenes TaxID=1548 RepID=A0A0E3GQQ4_CLOSL|nr:DUF6179 domain-containing protein [Clostridium scatologenes]AKA68976.1 hypothetical protein CSCA_1851 [Clostridium scatologenes]
MGKSNSIEKYGYFWGENFDEESFLKEILAICYQKKLLNDNALKKVYFERMELLKEKLKYYTKDESSSVRVEIVESILKCIDYTIGIYLKSFNNIDLVIREIKNTCLFEILSKGQDLISEKVLYSKKLLCQISKNKLKVDNYSYNDTIDYGIPLFFKEYNSFFAAHEGSGAIDYQLYIDNMNYTGIEYIYNYLETLSLENEFCHKFHISEINNLLKAYSKNCELLLINIFELVFINSIGMIICGKELDSLNITSLDRKCIKNKLEKLSLEELKLELLNSVEKCCKIFCIKNQALIAYMKKSALKAALLINERIRINRLESIFLSFNEDSMDEMIQYNDSESMSDYKFKKLSEKIRDCSLVEDKIKLIKDEINSLKDLFDILSADCLFEDEYIMYFKSLSQMEVVLLSRYIYDLSLENEYEKEWYSEFNKYISGLSEKEQNKIKKLMERIQL